MKYTIYAYLARSLVIWPFIPKSMQGFNLGRDDPRNPEKTAKFDQIECTFDDEGKLLSYNTSQSIEDTVATLFQAVDKPLDKNPYFMQRVEEVKTGKKMSPEEAEAFRKNFCWTLRHPQGPRKVFTLKDDIPRWSTYMKVHIDRDDDKKELAYWPAFQMTPGGDGLALMNWKDGYLQGMPEKVRNLRARSARSFIVSLTYSLTRSRFIVTLTYSLIRSRIHITRKSFEHQPKHRYPQSTEKFFSSMIRNSIKSSLCFKVISARWISIVL